MAIAHQPEPPSEQPNQRPEPSIGVSETADWAASLNRIVSQTAGERAQRLAVTVFLDDGDAIRVRRLIAAPGAGFVTLTSVSSGEDPERIVVVPLSAIRKVELIAVEETEHAFEARTWKVGFGE